MSFDLFRKIIDEIENKVYSLKFTGRGEPTMLRQFETFMEYMSGKSFGEVSMITNGQLLTDDKMDSILNSGMDTISFSIDGLKEQYEEIRAPGKYHQIISTVSGLYERRNKIGKSKPIIRIQSVMLDDDRRREFIRIWEPISDDIFFLHFKDYSIDAENIQKPNYACPMPVQRLMVHWNGTVPMCINDEYEAAVVGNLNNQTISQIWQGQAFKDVRKAHTNGLRTAKYENCAKCSLTRVGHGNG